MGMAKYLLIDAIKDLIKKLISSKLKLIPCKNDLGLRCQLCIAEIVLGIMCQPHILKTVLLNKVQYDLDRLCNRFSLTFHKVQS